MTLITPTKALQKIFSLLLHTLWPVSCPVCGRLGSILCDECRKILFSTPPPPRCLYCENTVPCPVHAGVPVIHSGTVYSGQMRRAILILKDGHFRALGSRLGEGLAMSFQSDAKNFDALLPVPLHIGSAREYNQSFEIVRGMNRVWKVPIIEAARWSRIIQKRVGLGAAERRALTPDAFTVSPEIRGMRVALVDDVCTTGTTLACLAQACENAGAIVTGAYTLAQTVADGITNSANAHNIT